MLDSAFKTYSCITYYAFFKLSKLLGGKTISPPPNIFIEGQSPPPPPPRNDASGHPLDLLCFLYPILFQNTLKCGSDSTREHLKL